MYVGTYIFDEDGRGIDFIISQVLTRDFKSGAWDRNDSDKAFIPFSGVMDIMGIEFKQIDHSLVYFETLPVIDEHKK